MARNEKDFCVRAGETFHPTLRWGTGVITAAVITAITQATPAVITATAHGLPNGWPCACVGVQGMTEINATRYPPEGDDWHYGTVVDANTVQLNDVSSANFTAYASGGALAYDTPTDMAGINFTLSIFSGADRTGTPLATLTSSPAAGITVDLVLKTITPLLQTSGLAWTVGYYRLDATDGAGIVTELLRGIITIE